MTNSKAISEAVGKSKTKVEFQWDCTRSLDEDCPPEASVDDCPKCTGWGISINLDDPDAWPKLYEWIEEQGLRKAFMGWLGEKGPIHTVGDDMDMFAQVLDEHIWLLMTATEAQKSEALKRALEERDNAKDSD